MQRAISRLGVRGLGSLLGLAALGAAFGAAAGCGAGAFEESVGRRDLGAAIRLDREARHDGGVSESRLVALAELTLLEAVRRGDARERAMAFGELRSLLDRGEPLLAILSGEGLTPEAAPAGKGSAPPPKDAPTNTALVEALWSPNPALRARAALLLGERGAFESLRLHQLGRDPDRHVRLLLAVGLLSDREAAAWSALSALAPGHDLPAAQAGAELASRGDRSALAHLGELALAGPLHVRVAAIRGLGRARPEPRLLPNALAAPEAEVRIAAAGSILFALSGRD